MRLVTGVLSLAVVGIGEGLVALMITPALDRVLNPGSADPRLLLLNSQFTGPIYLNSFLPHQIHFVWTIFALGLMAVFFGKGLAEYFGNTQVQFAGLAAVIDL